MMTRLVWPFSDGECWDQAMLGELFAGKLWRRKPLERIRIDNPMRLGRTGGVFVFHGEILTARHKLVTWARSIQRLPWAVVVVTSDECNTVGNRAFRFRNTKIWREHADASIPADERILIGYPCETREHMQEIPRLPISLRQYLWAFGGQAPTAQRQSMVAEVATRTDGDLLVTDGFAQGRSRPNHLRSLAAAAIALCPVGNQHPDCLRHYEALEAGCLPISDRNGIRYQSRDGFWWDSLGLEPFPCVDDWRQINPVLDAYRANPVALQRDANRATAWWLGYKRDLSRRLDRNIARVSGVTVNPRHPVTVLMPTSSIPAHPSTALIESCIAKTRAYPEMADAEILIMVDGLHPNHAHRAAEYEEFKRALIDKCSWSPELRGCVPIVFDHHTHQANMTREALNLVDTPLIFFQEHDTFPCHRIEWDGLFAAFDDPTVNQIQLHIDYKILPEHEPLMMDRSPREVAGVKLRRHRKWSQRPHLARTDWYRKLIARYFGKDAKTMIEDVLHGPLQTRVGAGIDKWEEWGTHIYEPDDPVHGIVRSATQDGRDGEAKIPLIVSYDGPTPTGAPHPGVKSW